MTSVKQFKQIIQRLNQYKKRETPMNHTNKRKTQSDIKVVFGINRNLKSGHVNCKTF